MASEWQETALSEVIGFILILAIITAAASLYIVYVVPAQGREAEIRHMEYISGEFTGYKIGIDSLWINNRKDVTISRTVSLGTLGATTQGTFLNLPLFQPYGSGGTMVVNGRGDTIGYEVLGAVIEDYPGNYTPDFNPIEGPPRHLYIEVETSDVNTEGSARITPNPDNGDWVVFLNVTQMITSAGSGTINHLPQFSGQRTNDVIAYLQGDLYTWAQDVEDSTVSSEPVLTISIQKHGNETLTNWVIKRNIQSNAPYLVDLLDPAYGLGEILDYPLEVLPVTIGPVTVKFPVSVGYSALPEIEISPHPMGTLEYLSNNYYWIQQIYFYQGGAVFLEQPDDGSVVKVLPAITLTSDQPGKVKVKVTDIQILSSTQSLGGTGSAEVTSFISGITMDETESGIQFARGIPNAQTVIITVNTDSEQSALAWDGAFRRVKSLGLLNGVIDGWSLIDPHSSGSTTSTFRITGASPTGYDILLDYTRVNMSASLQSVAA